MDYESLGRSGEHFLAALQSGDASATQRFILPDGEEEVNISASNVSFLSLFGEEHPRHRVLALREQDRAVLALYLCSGWWAVEEALRTSDPSRHGLVEVQSVGERLVLFILNQIVYGTQESPPDLDNPLFTPHPPREQAMILWQEGEAAGFYTVKRKAVEAKGETDRLSVEELRATVSKAELERVTAKHAPSQTAAFWIQEGEMHKTELEVGQQLRLKTKGDGPFVFSLARLDGGSVTKCNFAGDEKAGASWTDKIMANKPESRATAKPAAQGDAAREDEWLGPLYSLAQRPRAQAILCDVITLAELLKLFRSTG
ncbi:UNVERIFIED_CONTAM: hypothetical protein FKN15_057263 [Acipenser sinensis]